VPVEEIFVSTVLIVDDDLKIARIIARYLEQAGFETSLAHDGKTAAGLLAGQPVDLVVLDILLPDTSGLKILRDLRHPEDQPDNGTRRPASPATAPDVPVLLLSALGMTDDIIGGLRSGADDYLVKPFEPRELVERVRTLLRRSLRDQKPSVIKAGGLELDLPARQARYRGHILELTRREYDLLVHLVSHPGRVHERGQLLDAVWGKDFDGSDRSVDLCILRLRSRLEDAHADSVRIDTSWGSGYRLTILPEKTAGA
jgi:DNA-binding response OmpR family regulator